MDARLKNLKDQLFEMMEKNTAVSSICGQWEAEVQNREKQIIALIYDRDGLKTQISTLKSLLNPQSDSERLAKCT